MIERDRAVVTHRFLAQTETQYLKFIEALDQGGPSTTRAKDVPVRTLPRFLEPDARREGQPSEKLRLGEGWSRHATRYRTVGGAGAGAQQGLARRTCRDFATPGQAFRRCTSRFARVRNAFDVRQTTRKRKRRARGIIYNFQPVRRAVWKRHRAVPLRTGRSSRARRWVIRLATPRGRRRSAASELVCDEASRRLSSSRPGRRVALLNGQGQGALHPPDPPRVLRSGCA